MDSVDSIPFFLRPEKRPTNLFVHFVPSQPNALSGASRGVRMRQRLAVFFSLLLVTAAFSRLGPTPLAAGRGARAMAITVWTTEDAEDKVLNRSMIEP